MGDITGIEWTDHTFNPWWGCTRVSPGCEHCYAETFAARFGVKWGVKAERRMSSENVWASPLRWNKAAEKAGKQACGWLAVGQRLTQGLPMTDDYHFKIGTSDDPPAHGVALGDPLHINAENADQYRHIIGDALADMIIQWGKEDAANEAAGLAPHKAPSLADIWRSDDKGERKEFLGRFGLSGRVDTPKSPPLPGETFGPIFRSRKP